MYWKRVYFSYFMWSYIVYLAFSCNTTGYFSWYNDVYRGNITDNAWYPDKHKANEFPPQEKVVPLNILFYIFFICYRRVYKHSSLSFHLVYRLLILHFVLFCFGLGHILSQIAWTTWRKLPKALDQMHYNVSLLLAKSLASHVIFNGADGFRWTNKVAFTSICFDSINAKFALSVQSRSKLDLDDNLVCPSLAAVSKLFKGVNFSAQ